MARRANLGTPGQRGPNNARWKGGRHTTKFGYVEVYLAPDDPFIGMARSPTTSGGAYIYEHRLKMAKKLGRVLAESETVHHKNGIKSDNRLSNLQLLRSRHPSGQHFVCFDCGSDNVGAKGLN